jgi:tetratricopeptide (TPR) repeat protein
LGWTVFDQGNQSAGLCMMAEARDLLREVGDRDALVAVLIWSTAAALAQGDSALAQTLLEEALATSREMGQLLGMQLALSLLGQAALAAGDIEAAHAHYVEALQLSRESGQHAPIAMALRAMGGLWVAADNPTRAARIFGAEAAIRGSASVESMAPPLSDALASRYEQDVAAARAGLDPHTFAAAWATGEAMALNDAVAYAMRNETD